MTGRFTQIDLNQWLPNMNCLVYALPAASFMRWLFTCSVNGFSDVGLSVLCLLPLQPSWAYPLQTVEAHEPLLWLKCMPCRSPCSLSLLILLRFLLTPPSPANPCQSGRDSPSRGMALLRLAFFYFYKDGYELLIF